MSKKKTNFTARELQQWEVLRKDKDSDELINPKTGKSIKRDGPKFQELEAAFERFESRRTTLRPDESAAAAPKSKMEDVLAIVLESSAQKKDTRTAAKIGMVNRTLRDEFKRRVPSAQMQARRRFFVLEMDLVRQLINDAANYPIHDVSSDIVELVMQVLSNRVKYVRELTRAQKAKTLLKPTETPRKEQTISQVIKKFETKYRERPIHLYMNAEKMIKEKTLALQSENRPLSEPYGKVKERILDFFDVDDKVATFLTRYIQAYVTILIETAIQKSKIRVHGYNNEHVTETMTLTRRDMGTSFPESTEMTVALLTDLVRTRRLQNFFEMLNVKFVVPDQIMWYKGKETPLLDVLEDFDSSVSGAASAFKNLAELHLRSSKKTRKNSS